jgi:Spy/CpxP family protein refolding chaperone
MYDCRRSGIVLIFVAGMLLAPASFSMAADKSKADEEMAAASVENELSLTQEQKDKLKSMREQLRSKQTAISNDLRSAKSALQKELDSPNPDRKKADNLVATVNKLQSQMLALRVDQVFSMRAIMTPEQYQKLLQLREKRREEMKAKVQKGKGTPPPVQAKPADKKTKKK